ncbi:MAG: hypothetical protein ACR2IH_01280 [Pyrinomonadaceae bacterium]
MLNPVVFAIPFVASSIAAEAARNCRRATETFTTDAVGLGLAPFIDRYIARGGLLAQLIR